MEKINIYKLSRGFTKILITVAIATSLSGCLKDTPSKKTIMDDDINHENKDAKYNNLDEIDNGDLIITWNEVE